MKGSKDELVKYLTRECGKRLRNKKELREITDYMVKEGFPVIEVTDAIQLRKQMADHSDRMLFYFLKSINEINKETKKLDPEEFFSAREIKEYETTKYKPLKFSFPIKWQMVEVVEGSQWIGKISVKELMQLRDAQLINYNERTQRTLKRVGSGDYEYYQIYLNRNAVDAIIKSYTEGQYIPNTITLNIPEAADFKYSDGTLTIKETDRLDILDGYHRYIAMSNIFNQDSNFDYEMELRVVCFSEETARQFIWQEDQKTKMRKLDSDSLNQNSPANQIINIINQTGLLKNIIGRNEGIIDQGLASNLIDKLWFNTTKVITRKQIIEVKDKLIEKFNLLLYQNPDIFEKRWNYEFTVVAFVLMKNEFVPEEKLLEAIEKQTNMMCEKEEWKIALGHKGMPITTRVITRVNDFYRDHLEKEV